MIERIEIRDALSDTITLTAEPVLLTMRLIGVTDQQGAAHLSLARGDGEQAGSSTGAMDQRSGHSGAAA